jgi:flagellar hook-associated protein 2
MASGLDTGAIIESLMQIERRPIALIQQNKAKAQQVLDRYRALNTKLAALQTAAKNLQGAGGNFALSPFAAKTATTSDATKLKATADGNATVASYNVVVNALAREQKTGGGAFLGNASGQLTITDSTGTAFNVAVTAGQTAEEVAGAINSANGGMSASVISGTLVLTGKQSGEVYTLSDDTAGALKTSLGLDANLQTAQQASITVDGVAATSKSNTFTSAISGVSLTVSAEGAATLTVGQDNTAATDKIKDLVNKYNDIIKQIKEDTKYDATTKRSGPLIGDSFVSSLQGQLNRMLSEVVDPSGPYKTASDLGISTQRDGLVTIDDTKLSAALANNPSAVFKLFGHEDANTTQNNLGSYSGTVGDGIATRLAGFVDSMIASASKFNQSGGVTSPGGLFSRINAKQDSMATFDKRIESYENRLELRERGMRTRFLAMETVISKLKNQGNYFASQMSGLSQ